MNRRALLDALACATSDLPHLRDVIAPFGFEVSQEYLPDRIRPQRLYLYAMGQPGTPAQAVSSGLANWMHSHSGLFVDALGRDLAYITANSRQSVTVVREEGFGVHIYIVPSDVYDDLSLAYGHYVALIPLAISSGVLRELVRFDERPSCRRFVFQFARMFPYIHGITYSPDEEEALRQAADANGSRMPGNPLRLESLATEADWEALHTIVLPTCHQIARSLADEASDMQWIDFHSGSKHALTANLDEVGSRARFIAGSYRSWGLIESYSGG